ncbi:hypothetical protein MVEN_02326800 [Mycena venus]|uniref:DUF6532 domain-containing protein n=1 Tax=Mycena venus TaxID=2733690 RepID=A0A8H6X3D8_9AGAR|nr:hypothetical protein MVEN_02326800 [Mycena venus]
MTLHGFNTPDLMRLRPCTASIRPTLCVYDPVRRTKQGHSSFFPVTSFFSSPIMSTDSDSEDAVPQRTHTRTKPRGRDVSPDDGTPLPPRRSKPSEKVATINKENLAVIQDELAKAKKKINRQAKQLQKNKTGIAYMDDGPESEERQSEPENVVSFASAIRPLGQLDVPDQRPQAPLRKTSKKLRPAPARTFLRLPEPTEEHRAMNAQEEDRDESSNTGSIPDSPTSPLPRAFSPLPRASSPLPRASSPLPHASSPPPRASFPRSSSPPPPRSSSPLHSSSPTARSTSTKRARPACSPPPPAKRAAIELPRKEAEFAEGFTLVPGARPKASDYAPIPHALILRACADYAARIVAIYAFPEVKVQLQWAKERLQVVGSRFRGTIRARGSQIRGKIIEAYRALFATQYGFERSTSKKIISANEAKATRLLKKAAFHYRDPAARKDYGGHKIIAAALFPMWPSIFLRLNFCINEWATGSFIQSKFLEKDVGERYCVHLVDTEKWSNTNEEVVKNIRHKWYRKASQTLMTAPVLLTTNMDEADEEALRDELAGRTGNTDTESEDEDAAMVAA